MTHITNDRNIIKLSLDYYDKNMEKYNDIYNNINKIRFESSNNDLINNKIFFYDKNNKIILESSYEIMGVYYNNTNIWIWGWALYKLYKNKIKIIKKIFDYGIQLNPDNQNNITLKGELLTSRLQIDEPVQLEIYSAIASYLSKNPNVFKYSPKLYEKDYMDEDIIYYLFIY